SERNTPSSSDHSFERLQNCWFVSLSGAGGAACPMGRRAMQSTNASVRADNLWDFMDRNVNTPRRTSRGLHELPRLFREPRAIRGWFLLPVALHAEQADATKA